jgi:hypothetical protein
VRVDTYHLTPDTIDLLLSASDRLLQWQEPELPNDLSLLQGDRPWLTNMANERLAILTLSDREKALLEEAVPELRLRPCPPSNGVP